MTRIREEEEDFVAKLLSCSAMLEFNLAIAGVSVCPSMCHTLVSSQN